MDKGRVQPQLEVEATQSDKDKGVGWSGLWTALSLSLSLYNEDAPRQLLSSLAALGGVTARPETQAFRKKEQHLYHRRFVY